MVVINAEKRAVFAGQIKAAIDRIALLQELSKSESYGVYANAIDLSERTLESWTQTSRSNLPKTIPDQHLFRFIAFVTWQTDLELEWLTELLAATSVPVPSEIDVSWLRKFFSLQRPIDPITGEDMSEVEVDQVIRRLIPEQAADNKAAIVRAYTRYRRFIGRHREFDTIMAALKDEMAQIIGVYGMGGMGKTAFATNVEERLHEDTLYEHTVWISTAKQIWTGSEYIRDDTSMSFQISDVIDEVARQIGATHVLEIRDDKRKTSTFARLMKNRRILIILDAFEYLDKSEANTLLTALRPLLGHGNVLVTSRHQFSSIFKQVRLKPLVADESIALMRSEASQPLATVETILNASDDTLRDLHTKVGGLPLGLRWLVGQLMQHVSLENVVQYLTSADKKIYSTRHANPHYLMLDYIFNYSWQQLNTQERLALICISEFPPDEGVALEFIRKVFAHSDQLVLSEFDLAQSKLVSMSLVDKTLREEEEYLSVHAEAHRLIPTRSEQDTEL